MALKSPPIDKALIVDNANPIDYSKYRFTGNTVLLGIPTEATTSGVITYTKLNLGVWFPVVAKSESLPDDFVKIGDRVLLNPDLPVNQIPVIKLERKKHLRLEWHEIFVVVAEGTEVEPVEHDVADALEGQP